MVNQEYRMKRFLLLVGSVAALALIGCGGDTGLPEATGESNIRAINAIPSSPGIAFLIEERGLGNVDYKQSSNSASYDDLEYTFNFDVFFPGETARQRVASAFLDVVADKEYIFLISGVLTSPTITLWEGDVRSWEGSETVFSAQFAHAAESMNNIMGDIDVYFAAPGVVPVLGEQRGTLSFGQILPAIDLEAGDHVLTMTAAGDPSTVLYTSDTIALAAQTSLLFSVFDADANDTGPVAVRIFNASGLSSAVPDVNNPPTLRFIHASMALATADIYAEETLATPIVTGHAYADITDDIAIPAGETILTYTALNNIGAPLFDDTLTIPNGVHSRFIVVGADIDSLAAVTTIQDRRAVDTIAKFGFMNAASNHALVDVYLVEGDLDITDLFPQFFSVGFGIPPLTGAINPGSYKLYVTPTGEKTVISGPISFDMALGDIVDLIALDTADPATAQVLFIPVPQ
jgi:hypothetical protein